MLLAGAGVALLVVEEREQDALTSLSEQQELAGARREWREATERRPAADLRDPARVLKTTLSRLEPKVGRRCRLALQEVRRALDGRRTPPDVLAALDEATALCEPGTRAEDRRDGGPA